MIVLLKDACTVAIACGMFFFSFLPLRGFLPFFAGPFSGAAETAVGSAMVPFYPRFWTAAGAGLQDLSPRLYFFVAFFLPAIVWRRGPFRVRAFVCVR